MYLEDHVLDFLLQEGVHLNVLSGAYPGDVNADGSIDKSSGSGRRSRGYEVKDSSIKPLTWEGKHNSGTVATFRFADDGLDEGLDRYKEEPARRPKSSRTRAESVRELVKIQDRLQRRSVDHTKAREPADSVEDEYSRRSNPRRARAQSVRELVKVPDRLQRRSVDYTKAREPTDLVTDVKATTKVKGDDNIVEELEEDSYAKRSISDASAASDRSDRGKHSPLNADFRDVQFTEDVDTTGTVVASSSSVVPVSRTLGALLQSQISPSVFLHQRRPQQVEDTASTSSYTSAPNSINFTINNAPAPLPVVNGLSRTNPVDASFSFGTLSECQTYSEYVTYCCRCVGWMGLSFATIFKTPLRILVILLFAICCVCRIKWVSTHCTLCSTSSANPVCEVPGFSRLLVFCSVDEMWDMKEAFDVPKSCADVAKEGEAALALPYAFEALHTELTSFAPLILHSDFSCRLELANEVEIFLDEARNAGTDLQDFTHDLFVLVDEIYYETRLASEELGRLSNSWVRG